MTLRVVLPSSLSPAPAIADPLCVAGVPSAASPTHGPEGPQYTALIRTHDSSPRVEQTVAGLKAQTWPPTRIVAVDSGSAPTQRQALDRLVDTVVDYPDEVFNYSKSINVGVAQCRTPWVLIISSHILLGDVSSIERAFGAMTGIGASAFYLHRGTRPEWKLEPIDRRLFDGRNGLSNSCAFLQTQAVMDRPFREEVFSAEDQEWAAEYLRRHDTTILRIGLDSLKYNNPNENELKLINEEISIAYFTCRDKLGAGHLVVWLARAAVWAAAGRTRRAKTYLTIFRELVRARFRPPMRVSKYY